jgi:hypothetical protein
VAETRGVFMAKARARCGEATIFKIQKVSSGELTLSVRHVNRFVSLKKLGWTESVNRR